MSLDDYITNMPENQNEIYYISGESIESVQSSSFVEGVRSKGFNVLYMTEPIDEYVLQQLTEYEGKKLTSITKEGFQLPESEEEKTKFEEVKKEFESTCNSIQEILKDKCEKVFLSNRLIDSPCCVVTSQFGWSANMERIMKAQALNDNNAMSYMMSKKNLEINPYHPIIKNLKERLCKEEDKLIASNLINLLFDTSLINSGFSLDNPGQFSHRMFNMVKMGLGIDSEETETKEETLKCNLDRSECSDCSEPKSCSLEANQEVNVDNEMEEID